MNRIRTERGWNVGRLSISNVHIDLHYFDDYGGVFYQVDVQFIGPDAREPDSTSPSAQFVQSQKIFPSHVPEDEAVRIVLREAFLHEIDEWLRDPSGKLLRVAHPEDRIFKQPLLGFESVTGVRGKKHGEGEASLQESDQAEGTQAEHETPEGSARLRVHGEDGDGGSEDL